MFRRALVPAPRASVSLAAAALSLALVASGCTGQEDNAGASEGKNPDEVMALAKKTLDETSGVEIELDTEDLPDGITGISHAEGHRHPPAGLRGHAHRGGLGALRRRRRDRHRRQGLDQVPFTPDFTEADPADYGAPDPAALMTTEGGLSDLLVKTDDLETGDAVRGGDNNEEILTEYTGTVPAERRRDRHPERQRRRLRRDVHDHRRRRAPRGEAHRASSTPTAAEMTYTIGFDDYGTEKDITAP